jgi:hypothetical protein
MMADSEPAEPAIRPVATPEPARSVVWRARVRGPFLLRVPTSWFDPLSVVIVALMALNFWIGNWPVGLILVVGLFMRWWLVREYLPTKGIVEHEVSVDGIRRGKHRWDLSEFTSYWVYHTDDRETLELVLIRPDAGRAPVRFPMPAKGLTSVRQVLDQRLVCQAPVASPSRQ